MKGVMCAGALASVLFYSPAFAQSDSCLDLNDLTDTVLPGGAVDNTGSLSLEAGDQISFRVVSFGTPTPVDFEFVFEAPLGTPAFPQVGLTAPGVVSYLITATDESNAPQRAIFDNSLQADAMVYRITCQFGAPTVASLGTPSGAEAGGTSVVITGNDLGGVTAVNFGGTAAASFVVNSNTQITAVSPPHASGLVQLQVVGANGSSANTAGDDFIFGAPAPVPTLTEWAMILMAALLAGLGGIATMRGRTATV